MKLRPSTVDRRLRRRLIVTLHSGESFAGVLWEADERAWVLRSAVMYEAHGDTSPTAVDGEVVILVENVAFAQAP